MDDYFVGWRPYDTFFGHCHKFLKLFCAYMYKDNFQNIIIGLYDLKPSGVFRNIQKVFQTTKTDDCVNWITGIPNGIPCKYSRD